MLGILRRWALAFVLAVGASAQEGAGQPPSPAGPQPQRLLLKDGWLLKSSAEVPEDGDVVSTARFAPQKWYPTAVPSTVLSALVKNGVYPDMRVGLNNFLIPDASDEFNAKHDLARHSYLPDKRNPWKDPYWYRTEFELPEAARGKRLRLHFSGINYRADVWLNGRRVADRQTMAGMYQRFTLDVTEQAKPARNCLAAKVYPVDHPGLPETQFKVFGPERRYQGKEIMKDVTMVTAIGYDCMPTVRDRNMGLWQEVFLDWTGPVDLRDPLVVTRLPLPQTSPATLAVSAELVNTSPAPVKGVLRGTVVEAGLSFAQPVELAAGETRRVSFSPEPVIPNPRLWWPAGYGPQNLYRLALGFEADGQVSDREEVAFGVRQIGTELHESGGWHGLRLLINGQRIFCRGGYIQPEILFDWDARRMEAEVRYFTQANLNLVYFEDIASPPDAFLDACDRYGLLLGNCFYNCYWVTPGSGHPADVDLLSRCTVDIVKRYRNHPSLWLYMAMNEGDTREDVYETWRRHVLALDGTRHFIPSGTFPDSRKDAPAWIAKDMPVGMTDAGASYTWQEPAWYYERVRESRNWMFMIESGSASLPPIDSLRRFIPDLGTSSDGAPFPLSKTWAEHGANHYYQRYDEALRRMHGPPTSVADYCLKGHLVTAEQHRAMFEAVQHRMWDVTSGFTQWKINACWPSVQWQIFDWYLRPMVSYYAIKRACEPLHVQLSPLDGVVTVVNHRLEPQAGLQARARLYDFGMKLRWEKTARLDLPADAYRDAFAVVKPSDLTPVYFVKLELADAAGRTVSDNFYWLSTHSPADYTPLADLPLVDVQASCEFQPRGEERIARVRLKNPTAHLAFFIHLAITKGRYGDEILPVLWDDNYLSLLPGETKEITVRFAAADAGGREPVLEVGGWNVRSAYDCAALELSRARIKPGEPLGVTATIANTFLDGSRVELVVDGLPRAAKLAWARAGRTEQARFEVKLSAPGSRRVQVGSQTRTVLVQQDEVKGK